MTGLTIETVKNEKGAEIKVGGCYKEYCYGINLYYIESIEWEKGIINGNNITVDDMGVMAFNNKNLADLLGECEPMDEDLYHQVVFLTERAMEEVVRTLGAVERYSIFKADEDWGLVDTNMDGSLRISKLASTDDKPQKKLDGILYEWSQDGRPVCLADQLVVGSGDFFWVNAHDVDLRHHKRMYAIRPTVYEYIASIYRRLVDGLNELLVYDSKVDLYLEDY